MLQSNWVRKCMYGLVTVFNKQNHTIRPEFVCPSGYLFTTRCMNICLYSRDHVFRRIQNIWRRRGGRRPSAWLEILLRRSICNLIPILCSSSRYTFSRVTQKPNHLILFDFYSLYPSLCVFYIITRLLKNVKIH